MMATTHGLVGLLLGAVLGLVAPEHASTAMAAGLVGGLVPDLDLYAGHRRTLHFPVYGSAGVLPAIALLVLVPTATTVALAAFVVAAAAHAALDVLGGGLELRPWTGGSERAVYSHYHGRWLRPRRWVPYDGSPQDLMLVVALGIPGLMVTTDLLQVVVGVAMAISATYTLLRKRLATIAATVASLAPPSVVPYVPDRYR